ncbi:MAG: 4'-phosphopantetheinyl transferase superfamily protein [Pseudomonadota bacterium]
MNQFLEKPLEIGEIHVIPFSLDTPPVAHDDLATVLSEEERGVAGRFRFEQDRKRFEASRGMRRYVLGSYLERAPHSLRFEQGRAGKPHLPDAPLAFNTSRSGGLGVIALALSDSLSLSQGLGVDIEQVERRSSGLGAVAEQYFTASERTFLGGADWGRRFFTVWTRKEALVKAIGGGIDDGLSALETHPNALYGTTVAEVGGTALRLMSLDLYGTQAASCTAALAWSGGEARICVKNRH